MARGWLSSCLTKHPECHSHNTSDWRPSRLVHIGSFSTPARLCPRSEIPPSADYLTLSHCWGKKLYAKLTSKTLAQFLQSIPLSALPKTYTDAIVVARSLNISYIWIDSLCILQDSAEDWRTECSTMGQVYQNAICNIAAAAARNGSEGCFVKRYPTCLQHLVLQTTTTIDSAERSQTPQHQNWSIRPSDTDLTPRKNAPLYDRGWVLQERFLAPRILHFGRDRVYWECLGGAASEDEPILRSNRRVLFLPKWDAHKGKSVALGFDAFLHWDSLIETYSELGLTMAEDRLPAFSGIAKVMAPHLGFGPNSHVSYLAGLWSWRLAVQLLWQISRDGQRVIGIAPSWSWASVIGRLHGNSGSLNRTRQTDGRYIFDITDYRTLPEGEDEFQKLRGGYIRGQGWLWKIGNAPDRLSKITWFPSTFGDRESYNIPASFDDGKDKTTATQYLLPILSERYGCVEGLILARDGDAAGTFVRIGHFKMACHARANIPDTPEADWQLMAEGEDFGLVAPDMNDFEERFEDPKLPTNGIPSLGKYKYSITII